MSPFFNGSNLKIQTMGTEEKLHRKDLQQILSFLSSIVVDQSGNAELDTDSICNSLLDNHTKQSEFSDSSTMEALEAQRAHVNKFKSYLGTLRALTNSLEKATNRAEAEVNADAMLFGITKLPEELVSIIFGHACSTFRDVCRLSHVCKRFRSTALSSPEVWANCELTLRSTPNQISSIANRSGAMHLKARVEAVPYSPLNFEGVASQHARLEELYISPINEPLLQHHFVAMHLPVLRHLSMRWSKYVERQHTDNPLTHIYETWMMPRLEIIDTDFIPRTLFDAKPRQCKLTFNDNAIRVSELLKFLGSSSQSEVLDVAFRGTSAWLENEQDRVVDMPNLRSFSLETCRRTSSSLLYRLLSSLNCHNLSNMSILIKENLRTDESYDEAFGEDSYRTDSKLDNADIRQRSDAFRQFLQRHNRIQNLNVTIEGCHNQDTAAIPYHAFNILGDIVMDLPRSLETLTLSRNVVVSWDVPRRTDDSIPRSINCISVTGKDAWTLKILDLLKAKLALSSSDTPKRIIIHQCASDLEGSIQALFPHSHVSSVNQQYSP